MPPVPAVPRDKNSCEPTDAPRDAGASGGVTTTFAAGPAGGVRTKKPATTPAASVAPAQRVHVTTGCSGDRKKTRATPASPARSETSPGYTSSAAANSASTRSQPSSLARANPTPPAASAVTPMIAVTVAMRIVIGVPSRRRSSGPYTNMNGTTNPAPASMAAYRAVLIGGAPEMPAAANAASETGGVTFEMQPK